MEGKIVYVKNDTNRILYYNTTNYGNTESRKRGTS